MTLPNRKKPTLPPLSVPITVAAWTAVIVAPFVTFNIAGLLGIDGAVMAVGMIATLLLAAAVVAKVLARTEKQRQERLEPQIQAWREELGRLASSVASELELAADAPAISVLSAAMEANPDIAETLVNRAEHPDEWRRVATEMFAAAVKTKTLDQMPPALRTETVST